MLRPIQHRNLPTLPSSSPTVETQHPATKTRLTDTFEPLKLKPREDVPPKPPEESAGDLISRGIAGASDTNGPIPKKEPSKVERGVITKLKATIPPKFEKKKDVEATPPKFEKKKDVDIPAPARVVRLKV